MRLVRLVRLVHLAAAIVVWGYGGPIVGHACTFVPWSTDLSTPPLQKKTWEERMREERMQRWIANLGLGCRT